MSDLQLITGILKNQKAVLQFRHVTHIEQRIDWQRFRNPDTTYFLFTKMKRDRVVKVPTPEQNEANALRHVLSMASHFPLQNTDLGLNSASRDSLSVLNLNPNRSSNLGDLVGNSVTGLVNG